jgi:hypothetical protein
MNKKSTQQEILLMTNTTFSKMQLCEKDMPEGSKHLSRAEQIEEACWNGLLHEMLPGIVEKPTEGKKLFLWNIRHGETYLQLELCEQPQLVDQHFSIDPYAFMNTISQN